jgi:superfamily II DNA/RNA helicase
MKFSDLGLSDPVLRAVEESGYTEPTPIQEQAIPYVLMGRDVLGCAQTGTGKTAGFTLPMIEILAAGRAKARMPRSLILEPTRELAAQVAENFDNYGRYNKLTKALLIGGVSLDDQIKVVDRGVDVLIATPGRLLDLFDRGRLLMTAVKIIVIDEADRMLDMGFIPDVERIVSMLPKIHQTLFFSATMAPEIRKLGKCFLANPREISVAPPSTPAATVTQGVVIVKHHDGRRLGGGQKEKRAALRDLIRNERIKNALIFCNRKRDIGVVCRSLQRHGFDAGQLHGDMSQPARTETLEKFKNNEVQMLVCSDVAARGLDIAGMSHVFNFDVPVNPEDYIHRIGRTARAGLPGRAFVIATPEDTKYLVAIEKLIGRPIPPVEGNGAAQLEGSVVTTGLADLTALPSGDVEVGPKNVKTPRKRSRRSTNKPSPKIEDKLQIENSNTKPQREPMVAKPNAKSGLERNNRQSGQAQDADGKPEVGMGKHVPAFMLRSSSKAG